MCWCLVLVLSPQTWLKISWHLVGNVGFWRLKNGWRCSKVLSKLSQFCCHKCAKWTSWDLVKDIQWFLTYSSLKQQYNATSIPLYAHVGTYKSKLYKLFLLFDCLKFLTDLIIVRFVCSNSFEWRGRRNCTFVFEFHTARHQKSSVCE